MTPYTYRYPFNSAAAAGGGGDNTLDDAYEPLEPRRRSLKGKMKIKALRAESEGGATASTGEGSTHSVKSEDSKGGRRFSWGRPTG